MPSKRIGDLLNPSNNRELSKALARSDAIGRLTRAIAAELPGEMGAAILAAAVDEAGVLTVRTTTSAWASRLRFEAEQLKAAAAAAGVDVKELKVRVGRTTQA